MSVFVTDHLKCHHISFVLGFPLLFSLLCQNSKQRANIVMCLKSHTKGDNMLGNKGNKRYQETFMKILQTFVL